DMKKIFAISMFSVLAVLGTMEAHATLGTQHVFDGGAGGNFNIATMNAVVPRYANDSDTVLITDEFGRVQFADTINQDQVSGLTDALAGKVDDTQVANAAADVASGDMDTMVPTVQRMANAIAEAVESGVGAVDLSSRVAVDQGTEKANQVLVTGADGKVTTATTITQAQVENLSTDLDAKFDKANVIDVNETVDLKPEDLPGKVYGADVMYFKDVIMAGIISGEESIPYDIMGDDGAVVTSLKTPDKHSIIDGINSVYDVVKINKTDIGNKVDKAQVVASDGLDMNGSELADDLTPDDIVPTVGMVGANFIPNVSNSYVVSTDSDYWGEETQGKAPAGSYIITVDVDQNGNATYHWVQYYGSDPV
ncbi:MAG: hypothetical protein IJ273_02950, partial [Alphaproteobacteria bacterium]|nr:hypothetical protein [Alphaproteobacteria bacterium]